MIHSPLILPCLSGSTVCDTRPQWCVNTPPTPALSENPRFRSEVQTFPKFQTWPSAESCGVWAVRRCYLSSSGLPESLDNEGQKSDLRPSYSMNFSNTEFTWNVILTVWGGKGQQSCKRWYQFTLSSCPFIPEIPLVSIFIAIQLFPLAYLYLLTFTQLELGGLFTSKHSVRDLVSAFRNSVSVLYISSLVDVVDWYGFIYVSTLKIFLIVVIFPETHGTYQWSFVLFTRWLQNTQETLKWSRAMDVIHC